MTRIEEVIKMVYRLYRKSIGKANSPCPDEETLVCFSEGRLSKGELEKIQEHIISCRRCAEVISLLCQRLKGEREVPEFLVKKAKSLVEQRPLTSILEIILVLKEKALQILEATGDVILDNQIVPLPVLRSRQISELPEEVRLIKEFKEIKITVHIQRIEKDKIRITLNLVDKINLLPLSDLRLLLLKGTHELESYEAISGNVVFDKVSLGRYAIEILREDEKLGAIHLEIK